MKIRKFWLLPLLIAIGGLAGTAKPNTAEASERDDFAFLPSRWIKSETIVLEQRKDEADVFFPNPPAVLRPVFENAFPVVAVLQGGGVDKGFYTEFGRRLARFGFVVVVPNHLQVLGPPGTPPIPFPDQFVILDVLAQMEAEDIDPGSPLFGIVDTERMGLTGHSVGGVVGLFAIDGRCEPPFCFGLPFFPLPGAVQAGAFYGTNTCSPGGMIIDERCEVGENLIDVETDDIPVALVQGSRDSIAIPAEAEATFDILDGPRTLISIRGANHYGLCDVNNPPGANPDPNDPTISQRRSVRRVARSVGLFLRAQLDDMGDDDKEDEEDDDD